jgi:hypothetical protein
MADPAAPPVAFTIDFKIAGVTPNPIITGLVVDGFVSRIPN